MILLPLFTDHILFKRLTEEPFFQTTKAVLELGPDVTEAVIRAFMNMTKVEVLKFPICAFLGFFSPKDFGKHDFCNSFK